MAAVPVDDVIPRPIRVLLADDHELVRVGLHRLIAAQPDLSVVGTAGDGLRAVELAAQARPDVVVMDLSMPHLDGVTATHRIRLLSPATRVLVLTGHVRRAVVDAAVAAGAAGYLTKNVPAVQVLDAIRRTHAGEGLFSLGGGR